MDEAQAIAATPEPRTRESLVADLRAAGVGPGTTVLVHSSLSALGWVAGGAISVVQALLDSVGPTGTLVMPAHSGQLTDPARWRAPPVPDDWIAPIRAHLPAYDPRMTPTRGMGAIAELFRTWPGTARSDHPNCSFVANGPDADALLGDHRLDSPLGEHSPLAGLYERDATIMLLGVDFDSCTMLHLAETRAWPDREGLKAGAPMLVNGKHQWVSYTEPPTGDMDHFVELGRHLVETDLARKAQVGSATAVLMSARALTDTAVARWKDMPAIG